MTNLSGSYVVIPSSGTVTRNARISMTNLSGSYVVIPSSGTVTRNASQLHKTLLFPVRVGQPGQEESL